MTWLVTHTHFSHYNPNKADIIYLPVEMTWQQRKHRNHPGQRRSYCVGWDRVDLTQGGFQHLSSLYRHALFSNEYVNYIHSGMFQLLVNNGQLWWPTLIACLFALKHDQTWKVSFDIVIQHRCSCITYSKYFQCNNRETRKWWHGAVQYAHNPRAPKHHRKWHIPQNKYV